MRILLLGGSGQVGTALMKILPPLSELVPLGREQLNLENLSALNDFLYSKRPDIIINAAAFTSVDAAEIDSSRAYLINSTVVEVLAAYCKLAGSLLIHYSTDYVFDGLKHGSYVESDIAKPLNVYGASKLAGEQFILQNNPDFLIFRTSWVFSSTGKNFVRSIIAHSKEKQNLSVVGDQVGAPTSSRFIAEVTKSAIIAYQKRELISGIYHLTSSGKTNWYEYACYIVYSLEKLGVQKLLSPKNIIKVTSEQYKSVAKRPKNSCLDCRKLYNILRIKPDPWQSEVFKVIENEYNTIKNPWGFIN